jgi:uroporphyrinogen-III decarboxylase
LAAVNHQEPDRVPTALWGSAYGITDPLYNNLLAYLNLGQGGGYVLAPVNHLQPDVPPENVVALFQAARKYGVYPLCSGAG